MGQSAHLRPWDGTTNGFSTCHGPSLVRHPHTHANGSRRELTHANGTASLTPAVFGLVVVALSRFGRSWFRPWLETEERSGVVPLRPERPTACAEVGLSPPAQLPLGALVRFAWPAAAESPRHWAFSPAPSPQICERAECILCAERWADSEGNT